MQSLRYPRKSSRFVHTANPEDANIKLNCAPGGNPAQKYITIYDNTLLINHSNLGNISFWEQRLDFKAN